MTRIYKQELGMDGQIVVIKDRIKRFLTVQFQPGTGICCWYEADDMADENEIQIIAIGTGWELPENIRYWDYIGTVQDGMGFVWHYYCTHFHNRRLRIRCLNSFRRNRCF